jgi:hypothetical protein
VVPRLHYVNAACGNSLDKATPTVSWQKLERVTLAYAGEGTVEIRK